MIPYPEIDPVAISVFGREVRWYSVMYMIGIVYMFWWLRRGALRGRLALDARKIESLMLTGVVGMMLGARTFYVLVYNFPFYAEHPEKILQLSQGGLSYHGALIGIALATLIFAKVQKVPYLNLTDHICCAVPLGIAFGRIGNFINGELWGRTTDVAWGMVFPAAGMEPRHPSQLYNSLLEGWLMFAIMLYLYERRKDLAPGALSGLYLIMYGCVRLFAEQFRQPDAQLGLLTLGLSMGQILCLLMITFGAGTLLVVSRISGGLRLKAS